MKMTQLFNELNAQHNLAKQKYPQLLETYGHTYLNYEAINGNSIHGRQRIGNGFNTKYDYTVKTWIDLAKLFLPTKISHRQEFYKGEDCSEMLKIISRCSLVPMNIAHQVISEFR